VPDAPLPLPNVPPRQKETAAHVPAETSAVSASSPKPSQDALNGYVSFYREYVAHLVSFLVWQGAGLNDAAELAQETMIEAYRNWSAIQHPRAWVKRVASRKYARLISRPEQPAEPTGLSPLLPPNLDISEWQERHEVLRLLALLPPRQRQVMAWTFDGYSPRQIANELNITTEAVRTNLKRARRRLAEALGFPEGESR